MSTLSHLLTPEKVKTLELIEALDNHAAALIKLVQRHPRHEVHLRRLAAAIDEMRLQIAEASDLLTKKNVDSTSRECGPSRVANTEAARIPAEPAGGQTAAQAPRANPLSESVSDGGAPPSLGRPGDSAPGRSGQVQTKHAANCECPECDWGRKHPQIPSTYARSAEPLVKLGQGDYAHTIAASTATGRLIDVAG